jgi:EAL domain-containing protein (putative c-di-GMP-specific phosphodiesterase class I)
VWFSIRFERYGTLLFTADFSELDLKTLLDREMVEVHFQPILSIREKKVIGFEGLSRGIHPISGKLIAPLALLKVAKEVGLILELDRLFRKKVLETFKNCCSGQNELLLSLNFETSVIDKEVGTLNLLHLCRQLNMDPTVIVIEILESKVKSTEALGRFVQIHRENGFLIALDDVGKGHSNLDRIPVIQPDILKIDRSLVMNLHEDYYRQEVFKSLVSLSQKIGALVLAEGVETEEETLESMELGADLLQGYYISEPQEPSTDFVGTITSIMDPVADKFRQRMVDKFNIRKMQHERYSLMMETFTGELSTLPIEEIDSKLPTIHLSHPIAEAVYVLNQKGLQLTLMSCRTATKTRKGVFRLPPKGTDYSMRDYYYNLMEARYDRETYTSEPYISPATGLFCLTIATRFKDRDGITLILCADVVPTYLKNIGRLMTLFGG